MKPALIPQYAIASKAVATQQRFKGVVLVAQLPRLAAQLADQAGQVEVDLAAEKDRAGSHWVKGQIRGTLQLTCQRGDHPFDWALDLNPQLRLVYSDAEEKKLLADVDPYRVEDDRLPLKELVEDEILLGLPMFPKCDDEGCAKP